MSICFPSHRLLPACLLFRPLATRTLLSQLSLAALQEYERLRGQPQESLYNLGRAAHHLGLLHIALHFYERALASPPVSSISTAGGSAPGGGLWTHGNAAPVAIPALDLRREIAFNMCQVYRASGATHLVRELYRTHLAVV